MALPQRARFSHAPIRPRRYPERRKPAAVAPPERPGPWKSEAQAEAEELLEDICSTLLLEDDADGWVALADLLPDELFDRLDRWLDGGPFCVRPRAAPSGCSSAAAARLKD